MGRLTPLRIDSNYWVPALEQSPAPGPLSARSSRFDLAMQILIFLDSTNNLRK